MISIIPGTTHTTREIRRLRVLLCKYASSCQFISYSLVIARFEIDMDFGALEDYLQYSDMNEQYCRSENLKKGVIFDTFPNKSSERAIKADCPEVFANTHGTNLNSSVKWNIYAEASLLANLAV
jgi:hypothetical protein